MLTKLVPSRAVQAVLADLEGLRRGEGEEGREEKGTVKKFRGQKGSFFCSTSKNCVYWAESERWLLVHVDREASLALFFLVEAQLKRMLFCAESIVPLSLV